MKKSKQKISYDKKSRVLSIDVRPGKSVDSDVHDNLVIDYDGAGRVVRVNLYAVDFSAFRELSKKRHLLLANLRVPVMNS